MQDGDVKGGVQVVSTCTGAHSDVLRETRIVVEAPEREFGGRGLGGMGAGAGAWWRLFRGWEDDVRCCRMYRYLVACGWPICRGTDAI